MANLFKSDFHTGACPGSLGELYQGPLPDSNNEIIVLSPRIPKCSKVFFSESSIGGFENKLVDGNKMPKLFQGLDVFCKIKNLSRPKGYWYHCSELPVGCGFSSSTADIIAAVRCVADFHHCPLYDRDLQSVLREIERSDGIQFDRLTLYSSSHQRLISKWEIEINLHAIFMFDGDPVNTTGVTNRLLENYETYKDEYLGLYNRLLEIENNHALEQLCELSTESATLNQKALPKKHFDDFKKNQNFFKADGIIVANTGTILGYLFKHKPTLETANEIRLFIANLGGTAQTMELY